MARIFNPPHPGGILVEQLKYLGIGTEDFARQIDLCPSSFNCILEEKEPITAEVALRISAVLPGPKPSTWLALQSDYDNWQVKNRVDAS